MFNIVTTTGATFKRAYFVISLGPILLCLNESVFSAQKSAYGSVLPVDPAGAGQRPQTPLEAVASEPHTRALALGSSAGCPFAPSCPDHGPAHAPTSGRGVRSSLQDIAWAPRHSLTRVTSFLALLSERQELVCSRGQQAARTAAPVRAGAALAVVCLSLRQPPRDALSPSLLPHVSALCGARCQPPLKPHALSLVVSWAGAVTSLVGFRMRDL